MWKAPRSSTSSALVVLDFRLIALLLHLHVIHQALLLATTSQPMKDMEGTPLMIELTRLNGSHLAINCDLIKYAEAAPDTVLTLVTGEKLVVLESCSEVSQRTLDYRAAVLRKAWPEAGSALGVKSAFDVNHRALHQARNDSGE